MLEHRGWLDTSAALDMMHRRGLATLLFAPAHALFTMAGMIFLMAQLDATMTLLSLAIAPFMVCASFLLGKPLDLPQREHAILEFLFTNTEAIVSKARLARTDLVIGKRYGC